MLSLRTTAPQQTARTTEATVSSQPSDQLLWSEAETTPWEGLFVRAGR